ncbi:MAG: hypothetical protein US69_C0008G0020 [candidate division TM6 bacterium GW2011_GWF2_38_10]|nr:MAG: hypothetical protein US69_C0008G0020 [candidate division TM6 bacterium GW2011_GWF2_38_10]
MAIGVLLRSLMATSIDGTTTVHYVQDHHVLHNADFVRGAVALRNGFTIEPGANAIMGSQITVAGGIDFRVSGELELERDVIFDSHVTLSSGGYIVSDGKNIHLSGDLVIPANQVLHVKGDMVIDGGGNTLEFASHAQLFLDNQTSVTLRNITIKIADSMSGAPAISLCSPLTSLTLDNATIVLGDDWVINRGSLFFHNDVVFSGNHALVYSSPSLSCVMAQSTVLFDHGTTFSYAPSSARDDLITLADDSAALIMNGSSLQTTFTGMHLTCGQLFFDRAGAIVNDFSKTITVTFSNAPSAVACSPDGRYVAVGSATVSTQLRVYECESASLTLIAHVSVGSVVKSISWSFDGQYIACGTAGGDVYVYYWNGNGLVLKDSNNRASSVNAVTWSSDGRHLAAGCSTSNQELIIYTFNGETLTQLLTQDADGEIFSIAWSSCGRYLAIGSDALANQLRVFIFDGSSLAIGPSTSILSHVYAVSWSPDCSYLLVGSDDVQGALRMYEFSIAQIQLAQSLYDDGRTVYAAAFSRDGNFVAVGSSKSAEQLELFSHSNGFLRTLAHPINMLNSTKALAWSMDSQVLVTADDTKTLIVWQPINTPLRDDRSLLIRDSYDNFPVVFPAWRVDWNMSGEYLAASMVHAALGNPAGHIFLYAYDDQAQTISLRDEVRFSSSGENYGVYALRWSPDGQTLVTAGIWPDETMTGFIDSRHDVRVYQRNGDQLEPLTSFGFRDMWNSPQYVRDTIPAVNGLSWSPDGAYLAVTGIFPIRFPGEPESLINQNVRVYAFDPLALPENMFTLVAHVRFMEGEYLFPADCAWSHTGDYIAVTGRAGDGSPRPFKIYQFNRVLNTLTEVNSFISAAISMGAVSWSYDDRFIAFVQGTTLYIYEYDKVGNVLTHRKTVSGSFSCARWDGEGLWLATVGSDSYARLYEFYSADYSLREHASLQLPAAVQDIAWRYDNAVFAVAQNTPLAGGAGAVLIIDRFVKLDPANIDMSSTLRIDAGIDDEAQGVDVCMLGDTQVCVRGNVSYR